MHTCDQDIMSHYIHGFTNAASILPDKHPYGHIFVEGFQVLSFEYDRSNTCWSCYEQQHALVASDFGMHVIHVPAPLSAISWL